MQQTNCALKGKHVNRKKSENVRKQMSGNLVKIRNGNFGVE